jgi:mRNA-degrading endonuclease RelE of RelBE toxin-antitoxin system
MAAYSVSFSKQVLKELEKINEPFYSNIKQVIIKLAEDPRPQGYKKLKGRDSTGSGLATIVLFMIYLMPCLS